MLKDITFGQYFESASIIHKIDPRIKIVLMIAIIVLIFTSGNFFALFLSTFFIITTLLLSKVPFKMYIKNMKAILPVLIFTAIINLFYGEGASLFPDIPILSHITFEGLYRSVFMALRILLLIFVSSVLTYTTTPNDLTDAIERLLSPLKYLGLKNAVHTLAMMMTIALRFIPTLIEEAEKIMNAQKARGADLESGGLVERVKALIPILIPLLISSVRRASELAEAMECRCYNGGEGKTRLKQMHLKKLDYLCLIVFVFYSFAVILTNIIF